MKRSVLLVFFGLLALILFAQTLPAGSGSDRKPPTRSHRNQSKLSRKQLNAPIKTLHSARTRYSRGAQEGLPQYSLQGTVNLTPSSPQLTAIDPFANHPNPNDPLKPARPFWYSVDKNGLTILTIDGNALVYSMAWPQTLDIVQPDGSFVTTTAPAGGWEPVGMTVSYPTEEQLASNSETPDTYVYVVMARSGYEWQSNPNPPLGRDPNLRDTLVPNTNPATESAVLIQVDVTDPTYPVDLYPTGPTFAGALLGHGAGQPAFEPATGSVYVGNMPSLSLPTTPAVPNDLTSFVSVIAAIVPPEVAAPGEPPGPPAPPIVLPFESPDVLPNTPLALPLLAEGGEGPYVWSFTNLPSWLTAHADKITGQFDGIIYGTVPANGSWTFQAQATDLGAEPPVSSPWTDLTLTVNVAAEEQPAGELPFEAGSPNVLAVVGTDSNGSPINPASYVCTAQPTSSIGSIVPAWIDVKTVLGGCVVGGTAPISGETYEFTLSNFKFAYPWDREAVVFSGNVAGPYVFDPLPAGVGLSGLAWHQIDKIHDASTEADVLNVEFFGVEPFTGQLYQILPPQGALEVGGQIAPPEISVELDKVSTYTEVLTSLQTLRPDIATVLAEHPNLKVKFGNLVVEASRDPNVYLNAGEILDPTGADPTVIPIGGPVGSTIDSGAVIKVTGTRDSTDPTIVKLSAISTINLPGVQAYFPSLDSDLSPAVRGVEQGQIDNGVLWVSGASTGDVAVVDTALGAYAQLLSVPSASSLGGGSVDFGTRSVYVAGKSLQNVTIFGTGTQPPPRAPKIWSGATTVMGVGYAGSFTVMASGSPIPTLSFSGNLPSGVTFTDNHNGTATLAGTPATGTEGDYPLTITASNGVPSDATQAFVLTVGTAPTITSANTTTFTVGSAGTFTVTATGTPVPTLSVLGALPEGVTLADNENGTATLAGTPATGTQGTYPVTITASNGAPPDATQNFTLIVEGTQTAPTISSASTTTFTVGSPGSFTVTTTGWPTPQLSEAGALPTGVTFVDNSNGTATLAGTPAAGTEGDHVFTITAANGVPPDANQNFTLVVNSSGTETAPEITLQPASVTVTAGEKATFTSEATGNPTPTVQWQLSTNGGANWSDIAGATSTNYTTPVTTMEMNGYQYRAVFTNKAGSATSNAATLTVNAAGTAPAITSANGTTFTVGVAGSFTVTTTGSPTPNLSEQGALPNGVTFLDHGNGTATLAGTPGAGTEGSHPFTITAANGVPPDATQNFTLTVNPQGGGIVTLSPSSLSFGKQVINTTSTAKTVTLTNSGTGVLTISGIATGGSFAIATNTCGTTLAAGAKCTVKVTFTPTVLGVQTGALTFTDDAPNSPQEVPLTGSGVEPATLTPISVTYGSQAVGTTSAAKTFILTNNQSVSLTDVAISTTEDFAISATTCTTSLAAKGKCTISVTFTPIAAGTRTGMLAVSDSASNSPQTASLKGTGVVPATLTPTTVAYDSQAVGTTSAAKTFTLTNYQSVSLADIAISTTGDFAISATTCTTSLAPKSKCTISVTFTPIATGMRTGILTVSDSASNSPQTASLKGTGVLPATLTPTSVTYVSQAVGTTSAPKTFTLTNKQSVSLDNITISTVGDFAISATTCTTSLAAKSNCTISVTFTPTVTGTRTGMLTVSDSAPNSPQTSNLKGTGK